MMPLNTRFGFLLWSLAPLCWQGCTGLDDSRKLTANADLQEAGTCSGASCDDGITTTPHEDASTNDSTQDDQTSSGDEPTSGDGDPEPAAVCEPGKNEIDNPSFDHDMSSWKNEDGDSVEADRASDTKALRLALTIEGDAPDDVRVVGGVSQCLKFGAAKDYFVKSEYTINSGPNSVAAGISIFFYESKDCSGDQLGAWGTREGTERQWSRVSGNFTSPPGSRSARVELTISKLAADDTAQVLFDDVLLTSGALCDASEPEAPSRPEPESSASDDGDESTKDDSPGPATRDDQPPNEDDTPPRDSEDAGEPSTAQDDAGGDDTTSEPTEPPSQAGPSYAETVAPIFAAKCVVGCHTSDGLGGPGALEALYGALDLSGADDGYAALFVDSTQVSDMKLVGARLEDSYLWYKLQGTQADVGSADTLRMPYAADPLDQADLDAVSAWILGGAQP
jgi:hypothetical protein